MSILRGFGENGEVVLSGQKIFYLMDSIGLPLDIINEILRANSAGFDVVEFVEAALRSGNFSYKTIRARLIQSMKPDKRDAFGAALDKVAGERQWLCSRQTVKPHVPIDNPTGRQAASR